MGRCFSEIWPVSGANLECPNLSLEKHSLALLVPHNIMVYTIVAINCLSSQYPTYRRKYDLQRYMYMYALCLLLRRIH